MKSWHVSEQTVATSVLPEWEWPFLQPRRIIRFYSNWNWHKFNTSTHCDVFYSPKWIALLKSLTCINSLLCSVPGWTSLLLRLMCSGTEDSHPRTAAYEELRGGKHACDLPGLDHPFSSQLIERVCGRIFSRCGIYCVEHVIASRVLLRVSGVQVLQRGTFCQGGTVKQV